MMVISGACLMVGNYFRYVEDIITAVRNLNISDGCEIYKYLIVIFYFFYFILMHLQLEFYLDGNTYFQFKLYLHVLII